MYLYNGEKINITRAIFVNTCYRTLSRRPAAFLVSAVLVMSISSLFLIFLAVVLYGELTENKSMAASMQKQIKTNKDVMSGYRENYKEIKVFISELKTIGDIRGSSGITPFMILNVIEKHLPGDIFVETFGFNAEDGNVSLQARARDRRSLSKFIENMESDSLIKEVSLKGQETVYGDYSFNLLIRL